MKKRNGMFTLLRDMKSLAFFVLFISPLLLCMSGSLFILEAAIPSKTMTIEYRSGKVSVNLKGVEIKDVIKDIAQKTGIEVVGLDEITGIIEDLEFKDLSLEEAIRTLGKNSILIFRQEGPQEDEMKIKKVIFLAQKEEEQEKPAQPLPPPPSKPTPPPEPPKAPTPPARPKVPSRPTPPPKPVTPTEPIVTPEPPPSVKKSPTPPPPPEPAPKPVKPQVVSKPKPKDKNLEKGEKYFKEKRWDLAIKYYKIYLDSHPEDREIKNKLGQANENTQNAISMYKTAKAAEKAGNFQKAYQEYKNASQLYPLLYDAWEKMREMQKKIK